jgi:imidazole glycerol-phosphate synthase subunit HisH
MRVTILDYGVGNLHSLAKAVETGNTDVVIESRPSRAIETDALILPGVGAFAPAAAHLGDARETVRDAIRSGLPTLGICLGMQLLFDESDEGAGVGLGVIPGRVVRLRTTRLPHMGWNDVDPSGPSGSAVPSIDVAYFANSYVCEPTDDGVVAAWTTYESVRFPSVVRSGATVGVQFHPEKSSAHGVRFVREFLARCAR